MSVEEIIAIHEVRNEQKNLYRKAIHKTTMDYLDMVKNVEPFGTRIKAPGEQFYNTFYWKAMKEYIMERDGYKCAFCGETNDLEIHHIIRRIDGGSNNPVNLKLLCKKCHDDIHHDDIERCYTYSYEQKILGLESELKSAYDMFVLGVGISEEDKGYIEKAMKTISELADIIRNRDESFSETGVIFSKPKTKQTRLGDGNVAEQ